MGSNSEAELSQQRVPKRENKLKNWQQKKYMYGNGKKIYVYLRWDTVRTSVVLWDGYNAESVVVFGQDVAFS